MGHFFQSVKRFKESWVRSSVTRQVTDIPLSESIKDPLVVCPGNQILELPTNNTDIACVASEVPELATSHTMLLEDSPAKATGDNSTTLKGMS